MPKTTPSGRARSKAAPACALCQANDHAEGTCHLATSGALRLVEKALLKAADPPYAFSQAAFAREIAQMSAENFSRMLRRLREAEAPGAPPAKQAAQVRFNLVRFLRDPTWRPRPRPAQLGRPEYLGATIPKLHLPERLIPRFERAVAAHERGKVGVLSAALRRFCELYTTRTLPPAHVVEGPEIRSRIDPGALADFDALVEGPSYRRMYWPVAVETWLTEWEGTQGRSPRRAAGVSPQRSP